MYAHSCLVWNGVTVLAVNVHKCSVCPLNHGYTLSTPLSTACLGDVIKISQIDVFVLFAKLLNVDKAVDNCVKSNLIILTNLAINKRLSSLLFCCRIVELDRGPSTGKPPQRYSVNKPPNKVLRPRFL